MVRIVTVRKIETERQKAVRFVKNSILFPSVWMGLISIILGYGALIYSLFKGRLPAGLIADSFLLLGIGIVLGGAQFFYQRFLFDHYPEYYAERQRNSEQLKAGRIRKFEITPRPDHRGRRLVPFLYLLGWLALIFTVVTYAVRLNAMTAFFLPLAGFYNLRFFLWKRKLGL